MRDLLRITAKERMIVTKFIKKQLNNMNYDLLPQIIIHLCLLYFGAKDEWSPCLCHRTIEINSLCVMRIKDYGYKSVFLKNVVRDGIHIWKFKVLQCSFLELGIAFTEQLRDRRLVCFGFSHLDGEKGIHFHKFCAYNRYRSDEYTFVKNSDVIGLKLNFHSGILSYSVNNIRIKDEAFVLYSMSLKYQYRVGLTLSNRGDKMKLMSYEHFG